MSLKPYSTLTDYITGKEVPNVGAEENRQHLERFLVEERGYTRKDIAVDVDIEMTIDNAVYRSQVDLVVSCDGGQTAIMVVKCCAGSPASREREAISAARLLMDYQIPLAVVSDAQMAIVMDTVSGKKIGDGLDEIPSKDEARNKMQSWEPQPLSPQRREKELLIFRTYDIDNVNVRRKL